MKITWTVKEKLDIAKLNRLMFSDDILIGYPQGRPHPGSDMEMDELARILTYGNDRIPARPFLEEGILEKKAELVTMIKAHYEGQVDGKGKRPSLKRIGAFAVGAVKEFVFSDYYKQTVPNAPSTKYAKSHRQKGKTLVSDKPLIDSGDMVNATTYVVVEGGV